MSACAGKTCCEIYRDKKYCSKAGEKNGYDNVCNCRHAVRPCDVGRCFYEDLCGMKEAPSLSDLIAERIGGRGK